MLLQVSSFLPMHAAGMSGAADVQPDRIKSEAEQLNCMGGSVSPVDWIMTARIYGIGFAVNLREHDVRAAFDYRHKQVGIDESGRFQGYVYARNDGPEREETFRPVRSPDVMVTCPNPQPEMACSVNYMLDKTIVV